MHELRKAGERAVEERHRILDLERLFDEERLSILSIDEQSVVSELALDSPQEIRSTDGRCRLLR